MDEDLRWRNAVRAVRDAQLRRAQAAAAPQRVE
jgi:hypothetical protein